MHSYRQTGEKQWTVYFYHGAICHTLRHCGEERDAAAFCSYMNGGYPIGEEMVLLSKATGRIAEAVEEIMHRMDTAANKRGKK